MFVPMQTVADIEQMYVDRLTSLYDASEIHQLFLLLVEERLGWSRSEYLLQKKAGLDDRNTEWFMEVLNDLSMAKPVQYVLGFTWFMNMKLVVNSAVLIPRPETEELVGLIIYQLREMGNYSPRVIDIGTGSGCIALALKHAFPDATVDALDASGEALRVAAQNAERLGLTVNTIQADILEWDVVFQSEQVYDVVVSNPPYIPQSEAKEMHRNVLEYEPHTALFVDDSSPLLFYDHIANFAARHLVPGGRLYFEVNRAYARQVSALLTKKGYTDVHYHLDIHGAERMVNGVKPSSSTEKMN